MCKSFELDKDIFQLTCISVELVKERASEIKTVTSFIRFQLERHLNNCSSQ